MITIIGVCIENRLESAIEFQRIITEHGCAIRTRIGIHPSDEGVCTNQGFILLEVADNVEQLKEKLSKHWPIQTMVF